MTELNQGVTELAAARFEGRELIRGGCE